MLNSACLLNSLIEKSSWIYCVIECDCLGNSTAVSFYLSATILFEKTNKSNKQIKSRTNKNKQIKKQIKSRRD